MSGRAAAAIRIGDPTPAAASLERDDQEERCDDDAEQPERSRPGLAGCLDDAGIEREDDTCHEPPDPSEEHRAEHDEEPGRDRDRDRGGCPQRQLVVPPVPASASAKRPPA